MIIFLLGTALGFACGYVVKLQVSKKEIYDKAGVSFRSLCQDAKQKIQILNERVKSLQKENESLVIDIKLLKDKLIKVDDAFDEQGDILSDLKNSIDLLNREKVVLEEKLQEYKDLYTVATQEIERLKNND